MVACPVEAAEGGATPPPYRVAFTPAFSIARQTARKTRIVTLSLFLRDALEDHPDFVVVPEQRIAPAIELAFGGAWEFEKDGAFRWMRTVSPLDVYIDLALKQEDGSERLAVATDRGVATIEPGATPEASAEALLALLVKTLALPQASENRLTKRLEERLTFFTPYYVSQRLIAATWGDTALDARLRLLTAFSAEERRHPLLAAPTADLAADRLADARGKKAENDGWESTFGAAAVFSLLGTPLEPAARRLVEMAPELFEATLMEWGAPLARGVDVIAELDALLNVNDHVVALPEPGWGPHTTCSSERDMPLNRRCGALRALGWMRSERGMKIIIACARADQPEVRLVAAEGLAGFTNAAAATEALVALSEDADLDVAWAAIGALRAHGWPADRCADRVRSRMAGSNTNSLGAEALQALADAPAVADIPLFRRLTRVSDNVLRRAATEGLCRLAAIEEPDLIRLLNDPDPDVVITVLAAPWPCSPLDAPVVLAVLTRLANEPFAPVANAARERLAESAPADALQKARLDLDTAHPYVRRRWIERLAADPRPEALALVADACANRDPHVRAFALTALSVRAPERARPLAVEALTDAHGWVRFHAAVVLAQQSARDDAAAIRDARNGARDPALRLYLEDALARAEGRPLPPPRPAAHSVTGERARVWMCGIPDSPNSVSTPYTAYYTCAVPQDSANIRQAHAAGKAIFPRLAAMAHPGLILLDPLAADQFWLRLHAQLTEPLCAVTDGVVYGEESMDFHPDSLWPCGWREFCREAKISTATVNGDIRALTPNQRLAWKNWAQRVSIEGFNALYTYTKLYYGKLRPGIQVATFLPNEYGFPSYLDRWQFDLGGYYLYDGDNRSMYGVCRLYRTFWPDRPVIWLSNGAAETGRNTSEPVLGVRYPVRPITARWDRAYADNLSVWLAGADPGYFSSWSVWDKDGQCVWLSPEKLYPCSGLLAAAIRMAFANARAAYESPTHLPTALDDGAALAQSNAVNASDFFAPPDGEKDADARRRADREIADRETYRFGHLFFALYDHDTARLFAGLPRHTPRHPALMIGPVSAAVTGYLNGFDAAPDIASLTALPQGLQHYRFIAVRPPTGETARVEKAAVASLAAWLRDTPGLFLVQGMLDAGNTVGTPTPENPEGEAIPPWPWEGAVTLLPDGTRGYRVTGNDAQTPGRTADDVVDWVLWRKPGWRGAVMFDCGGADRETAETRRVHLNALYQEAGIGIEFGTFFNQLTGTVDDTFAVAVSYHSGITNSVSGIDLLTGLTNQAAGPGRESVLASSACQTDYVVVHNGVLVLSERRFRAVERMPDGLRVETDGWVRVSVADGTPDIRRADGTPLPSVEGDIREWLFDRPDEEGVAVFHANGPTAPALYYVRAVGKIMIRHCSETPDYPGC